MVVQCPIWYLTLDELPIRLSSGCKFRAVHLARDTRATTDVVAASLCEAIFRGVVVLCAAHRAAATVVQIIMGRDQPLLKLRPGEQRPSLQMNRKKETKLFRIPADLIA